MHLKLHQTELTRGTQELLAAGVLSHGTQCVFILSFCSDFLLVGR